MTKHKPRCCPELIPMIDAMMLRINMEAQGKDVPQFQKASLLERYKALADMKLFLTHNPTLYEVTQPTLL